jgi:hypothetical protein
MMKNTLFILVFSLFSILIFAQKDENNSKENTLKTDLSDRKAIIKTIENFYIGDHTGSVKHKKSSMHKKGAYRYVNKEGKYMESTFRLDANNADVNYKEELLSIEIYDKVALARLRLNQFKNKLPEYKLMILHKADNEWKITSINWGYGVKQ